jgi:hypothetical protein
MGVIESITGLVAALRGISTFSPPPMPGPQLGDESVNAAREAMGGNLEPIPQVRLRWYPPDIERAQDQASNGDLTLVGQLCESMNLDGVIRGLGDARTSVVNMPKRIFSRNREIVTALESRNASDRSVYDEMVPSTESRLIVWDGIKAGVGVGEMVPVQGRDFPVLVRRYPQNLFYLWSRNQWYYRSVAGLLPIQPGVPDKNGNMWVLHIPGGRLAPWNSGMWNTLGRSYINKTQAIFARQSYIFRHSQPARVAFAALGATEEERKGTIAALIRWALNAAFVLPVGWDLKLIESNGQGIKVYNEDIATANQEIATALCGSSVMLEGAVGFGNINPFAAISQDLMNATADGWDHTVNTQILPAFVGQRWGVEALRDATTIETDSTAPKDREAEARVMTALASAIDSLDRAIAEHQQATKETKPVALNLTELLSRFGIPVSAAPEIVTTTTTDAPPPEGEGPKEENAETREAA